MFLRAALALATAMCAAVAAPAAEDNSPIYALGSVAQRPKLLQKVEPGYPPSFPRRYRIQGTARFMAVIGKDGLVEDLRLISGHPVVAAVASAAVERWIYAPARIAGEPVRMQIPIEV